MNELLRRYVVVMMLMFAGGLQAEVIDGWTINYGDASDPLQFTYGGNTLHVLSGLGPVFVGGYGPGLYVTQVLDVSEIDGYTVMECRAFYSSFSSIYYLKFKKLADNAMEMLVEGNANQVTKFLCGNIQGSTDYFKQFYCGQRVMEAGGLQLGGWTYGSVYWPTGGLYFYGIWDDSWTNGYLNTHRASPGANYLEQYPPISCDSTYGVLTNGDRPALKERYVIRASADLWESMGPVVNEPSEYGAELAEMVYFDHRGGYDNGSAFSIGSFALNWLKDVTAGKVRFLSGMQNWAAWNGWDTTNPDAWRIPDHRNTWPVVGTNEELREFISIGKTMGRVLLRCNYIWVGPDSWSIAEGAVKQGIDSGHAPAWYTDLYSVKSLAVQQENDIDTDFETTAVYHDQWGSMGFAGAVVNFDATVPGAGTLSATNQYIREICTNARAIHNGPLATEGVFSEYLMGRYTDTGDFQLYNVYANNRYDFTPAYKLNRLHQLSTFHSMGIGPWFFYAPGQPDYHALGSSCYFGDDDKLDMYRACEVLYGNGGYLQFTDRVSSSIAGLRKVHALTECFTVGVAQRYYAFEPVDYVKHGLGGQWKTLGQIIPLCNSLSAVEAWYKQFHIRYENGCHVWVNRGTEPLVVTTADAREFKLPENGWLVYTEDGNLTAYTALMGVPEDKVDFCEDIGRGIKYVNPRHASSYMGVTHPTVWLDGAVHYVLSDPDGTFYDAYNNRCGTEGTAYLPADISGPGSVRDCYVDMHDYGLMASQWQLCNDPFDPECTEDSGVGAGSYNFNDYDQMADWSITDNYDGSLSPIGAADSWKAAGGVDGSGHVRMLHNGVAPNVKLTLDARSFDKARTEISFEFAMNVPYGCEIHIGDAWFMHSGGFWWAGDAATHQGMTWLNPAVAASAMAPFSAPAWAGAVWNTCEISITDGIADISINGAELIYGVDWNSVIADTGNIFSFQGRDVSFQAFDDFSCAISDAPVCGDLDADITGSGGVPDCYVNVLDLAAITSQWLECTDPASPSRCGL